MPCLFKIPAVLQIALLKIFRCAVGVHFVYNLRCAENCTPQDHFRCVMVCYCTHTPQKTRHVNVFCNSLFFFKL